MLYKYELSNGYTEIFRRGEYGLKFISFGILRLDDRQDFAENSGNEEVALVILSGKCSIKAGSYNYPSLGNRASVFAGKAYGVYIPCNTDYSIIGESQTEIAICKTPSELSSYPALINPDNVIVRNVGQHNWKRYVHDIIDMRINASKIVVGETFNPPGNWSSYPPHRHDFDNLPEESEQEEVYFFKVEPSQGFGIQRIYMDDLSIDEVYTIRNNTAIAIPKGYHPVAAAPGYQVYYLWILAGEKRILKPKDDPAHAWIRSCETIISSL